MTRFQLRHAMIAGVAMIAIAGASAPANAQFFGGIVYDPTNYAQNVLTAARSLQQINNQIQSLQNEASSLVNEAKNLASLPFSSLQQLQAQVAQTQQLLGQAQRIAYDVQQIEQAFSTRYRNIDLNASDQALIDGAQDRWETSVAGFEDALKVQAGVVGNIDGTRTAMSNIVGASQSASGALQAAQAGNQLLALQSQQIADLTALLAAQGRAQSLESARDAATEAQGREQFRRFMTRSGN
ncbi:P-type conjugative transfer protein TrbJ [Hephaestia caeni]|uniref:P-type conjugative transfer protein TrbJ n=1 Tax=Hephaestia caeni TaxID=645617 RepID=A0A397NUM6_9SPHN|nr:P-type conjugative transfer protein TrbJ [Hephaestia caeni]RIA37414.1 P-type conjugative transfer protein TrbJ [Hephaestia caeni]